MPSPAAEPDAARRRRRWARARAAARARARAGPGSSVIATVRRAGFVIASTAAASDIGPSRTRLPNSDDADPSRRSRLASASSRREISTRARRSGRASAGSSSRRRRSSVAAVVEEVLLELVEDEQQDPAGLLGRARQRLVERISPSSPSGAPASAAIASRMARTGSPCQASTSTIARGLPPVGTPSPARTRGSTPARSSELLPVAARPVQHRQARGEQVRDRRGRAPPGARRRGPRPPRRRGSARGRARPAAGAAAHWVPTRSPSRALRSST